MQPQLGRRSPYVGRFPPDQRADTSTATKTAATLPGAAGSRGATVNQPPKSVVREICTPRSVGTGGGRPPPVTRWALRNERPYRERDSVPAEGNPKGYSDVRSRGSSGEFRTNGLIIG